MPDWQRFPLMPLASSTMPPIDRLESRAYKHIQPLPSLPGLRKVPRRVARQHLWPPLSTASNQSWFHSPDHSTVRHSLTLLCSQNTCGQRRVVGHGCSGCMPVRFRPLSGRPSSGHAHSFKLFTFTFTFVLSLLWHWVQRTCNCAHVVPQSQ